MYKSNVLFVTLIVTFIYASSAFAGFVSMVRQLEASDGSMFDCYSYGKAYEPSTRNRLPQNDKQCSEHLHDIAEQAREQQATEANNRCQRLEVERQLSLQGFDQDGAPISRRALELCGYSYYCNSDGGIELYEESAPAPQLINSMIEQECSSWNAE